MARGRSGSGIQGVLEECFPQHFILNIFKRVEKSKELCQAEQPPGSTPKVLQCLLHACPSVRVLEPH